MSQGVSNLSDLLRTSTYDNVPTLPESPGNKAGACDSKRDSLSSPKSEIISGENCSGEQDLESLQRMVQELREKIETQKQTYEEQIKT